MITKQQCDTLHGNVKKLYSELGTLPFHGWHHINFVYSKSAIFAAHLRANIHLTQAAALVHDLNYLVQKGIYTTAVAGKDLRYTILNECGLPLDVIDQIEDIVISAELGSGQKVISVEAMALSDADTLFKALPITPILFASAFIKENNYDIRKLARMITETQAPLIEADCYFHSDVAKREYMKWANSNLAIWHGVVEALNDPDVLRLIDDAGYRI